MRIHIISDLHLEFTKNLFIYNQPDCDVIIISGDLHPITKDCIGLDWLIKNTDKPIIYVAGNHEYYNYPKHIDELEDLLRQQLSSSKYDRINFLQNENIIIDGVKFIGATLWTDYNLTGNPEMSMEYAGLYMNDFRHINFDTPTNNGIEKAKKFAKIHRESLEYIISELSIPFEGKSVVITHHCPSPKSIHPRYSGDMLNPAFTSNLEHVIEKLEPDLWIHGHTHSSFDYKCHNTRVICNPVGYMRFDQNGFIMKENDYFRGDLVIHV